MDADLERVFIRVGSPPLWERQPGFPALLRIILEQQVSLASADAVYRRLAARIPQMTPGNLLELDDITLKAVGFSRQKTAYARILAQSILSGDLDLEALALMDDDSARNRLMRLKGIGQWTADIYLLMVLRRADIWPSGDLALVHAVRRVKNLAEIPNPAHLGEIAEQWKPWRAAAARLMWHYYLSGLPPI